MAFEVMGWFKEVYLNGKYYGSINMDAPDRDVVGYHGQRMEITTEKMKFKGRKIIPVGSEIKTLLYPLNGRIVKTLHKID